MPALLRSLLAAFLLLIFVPAAIADTSPSPGVAAYNKGDYKAALPLLEKEAAAGNAEAQTKLGLIYVKDLGVSHDPATARAWFEKAAAQGNAEAEYCLGVMSDIGDGVPKSAPAAIDWYRKAADKNYAKAQYNLASMYYSGEGIKQDYDAAAGWYRKAAEQKYAEAQFMMGVIHIRGYGVETNLLTARMWFDRAAAQGHADAKKGQKAMGQDFDQMVADGSIPAVTGGDGSSQADAIVFPEVKNEHDGVKAEHRVVAMFFRNWQWGAQSLLRGDNGHIYDMIEIDKGGETRAVYFDISNWFGKLE